VTDFLTPNTWTDYFW